MKLNKALIIFLIGTTSFASTLAISHPGEGRHSRSFMHPKLVEQLELTIEQQQLLGTLRETGKENREEIQTLRRSLSELTTSDDYSFSAAESATRQLVELQYQNMLANIEAQQAFYQALTVEQKEAVGESKANRKSNRRRF